MCPVCFTNVVLLVAGVSSGGGLTLFAATRIYRKRHARQNAGLTNNNIKYDQTQNRDT
jgi:hypothetical protein